jgi:uncharacterized protein YacL
MLFRFADISKFSDTSKYLPILNGAITTDLIILFQVVARWIKIKSLDKWYKEIGICAVLADVLSASIGVIIATFFYSFFFQQFNVVYLAILSVVVQLTHDTLFAMFFQSVPRGKSHIIDIFQDYGKEVGVTILLADAMIMVSTVFLGSLFASMDTNTNIIVLITNLYMIPYLLYSI